MNRHEGFACNGCGKVGFTGRCYRCLACRDFNICSECYENDFTTSEHPFDHPVKCVFTPADIELYFGGEYISTDPPQSYRCPYCKIWGFDESTLIEHVSSVHPNASPLLVSTMVQLFEQQQAARIFLEDEQLSAFTASANSRNEMMNRTEGSLDLYLEPLNPDGSYKRVRPRPETTRTATRNNEATRERGNRNNRRGGGGDGGGGGGGVAGQGRGRRNAGSLGGNPASFGSPGDPSQSNGSAAIDALNNNAHNAAENQATTPARRMPRSNTPPAPPTRRQLRRRELDRNRLHLSHIEDLRFTMSEAERQRLDFMLPPLTEAPPASPAQTTTGRPHITITDVIRYYGEQEAPHHVSWLDSNAPATGYISGGPSGSGRNVNIFGTSIPAQNVPRAFFLTSENFTRELPSAALRPSSFTSRGTTAGNSSRTQRRSRNSANTNTRTLRYLDFSEMPMDETDMLVSHLTPDVAIATPEPNAVAALEPPAREEERSRFLCQKFLTPSSEREPEEQTAFLLHRAEFVSQLLASALSVEHLLPAEPTEVDQEVSALPTTPSSNPKFGNRSMGDIVGAGDAELALEPISR
ncbi:uncharacterized protein LOC115625848 [Scaptodrosophila lebanonensis]|uniref:RING-type E3 ubiquitin transferase n=1 Tax=Drosophila lebanonensis TaxID=7225 RepID=A0A6J2TP69_DROLE|nr:uncharacterized protein LOC115625848 [Scaptodrosophila lebanonensis]